MRTALAFGVPAEEASVSEASVSSTGCPLCHTPHPTITEEARSAGESWQCTRCGQRWSAQRLATAAAYARYMA